jgi:endonuclease/exonuclease/phosphatase family metal-dependent hydrolase
MLWCRTAGIDLAVVHVIPHAGVDRKLLEVEQVLEVFRHARAAGRPVVLIGDFNCVSADDVEAFTATALERYRAWRWPLDDAGRPAELALGPITAAGAVDLFVRHRSAEIRFDLPRVDFVFASPDLAARSRACVWDPAPWRLRRSDHPPVVADFEWPRPDGRINK